MDILTALECEILVCVYIQFDKMVYSIHPI
jgi:hypothetical protein